MLEARFHELFRGLTVGKRRFVITTHINPDGDAIGSQVGLARFLDHLGHEIRMVNGDPTPKSLQFLEEERFRVEAYLAERHDEVLRGADLVVLVDNSAPDRLGRMEPIMRDVAGRTLCIDHHPTRQTFWKHNILDPRASATAAMIHELVARVGWRPDPAAAEALFVGIATDTGFFRFNSTSADAHRIAAELLELGVDSARCYQQVYERNSEAYTRLLGHALADLRLDGEGGVALVRLTRAMIDRCDAQDVDPSEMTTALLSMDGVRIALLFRELPDDRIKVSLRSKGGVDVHQLAIRFGGGGHRNASGIVIEGDLDDVMRRVTEQASAMLKACSEG